MKIGAVISEFNPFHNGHKYVSEIIKSENDAAVAVMSGNFVQRGDAALFDKFTRAKAAISGGFDLVLELPVEYAVNCAEIFAYGGVYITENCGCIDCLYFGTECGDIDIIEKAAENILSEPKEVSDKIKVLMKSGYGYSAARAEAFSGIIDSAVMSEPNNILAVEYVKALKRLRSSIIPQTFMRTNVHDGKRPNGKYASASLIRDMIMSGRNADYFIPSECADIFKNSGMADRKILNNIIIYTIRRFGREYLCNINGVSEGIENRIYKIACRKDDFDAIAENVSTKRYSKARIRRILISAILGLENTALKNPRYIRVLAMNKKGAEILSVMKKNARIPIITKAADYKELLNRESLATDIYSILCGKISGEEFTSSVYIDIY